MSRFAAGRVLDWLWVVLVLAAPSRCRTPQAGRRPCCRCTSAGSRCCSRSLSESRPGILASEYNGVSAFLRPINDTLQTMPQFVILIPFVMMFKIGEFTTLLVIMAYAVVPAIRYAEHALRSVPAQVVEAAACFGCTRTQLLWRVKLPFAMPVSTLELDQTNMFGIAMLVSAALVGTNGFGQQVYIGLGDGDFGVGIVAGIGMAFIAIIADRMTECVSRASQERLGLDSR